MDRRDVLKSLALSGLAPTLVTQMNDNSLQAAADVLQQATDSGLLHAAAVSVRHKDDTFSRAFGAAKSADDIFLLASISKPMSAVALLTLFDQEKIGLDDPVFRYLPEFSGQLRERITIRQLLTHISGLPDQLPENALLRQRHAPLSEFVRLAMRTPLLFAPGTEYRYSSMAVLLAAEVAERISRVPFTQLMEQSVFRPLQMHKSALGMGAFGLDQVHRCQTQQAAAESGGGDSAAAEWDWNSEYWRRLGAPWGGVHGSAADVVRFFDELLFARGAVLKTETTRLALQNHNPPGLTPYGLGMAIGSHIGGQGCSDRTFGHTGSTGTLAWADPATETICVVLTTLPAGAVQPHPRRLVSDVVAAAVS